MLSKISRNDALEDMAAIKAAANNVNCSSKSLLSLPHDMLFLIFQYFVATKRDVSNLERSSKTLFTLVNNNNYSYNIWLLFCKVSKFDIFSTGFANKSMNPLQIRNAIKTLHLHAEWKHIKIAMCGQGGVGKSALTIQFVQSTFMTEYDPTIEDDYRRQCYVDGIPSLFEIIDTGTLSI